MTSVISTIKRPGAIKPPRTVVYGTEKIGKTTFAAAAPSPVFIAAEDGEGVLDVPMFPTPREFRDVEDYLVALRDEPHEHRTAVIDSLDWLEPIIWEEVARENNVRHIEDLPYGKGYVQASDKWKRLLGLLNDLRIERRMSVILLCHAEIKRFDSPTSAPYDRYQMKLHRRANALVSEWADVIAFAHLAELVKTEKTGFGDKVNRAESRGRVLYLEGQPSFDAGNRYGLPPQIGLDYAEYKAALTNALTAARPKVEPKAEPTETPTQTEAA